MMKISVLSLIATVLISSTESIPISGSSELIKLANETIVSRVIKNITDEANDDLNKKDIISSDGEDTALITATEGLTTTTTMESKENDGGNSSGGSGGGGELPLQQPDQQSLPFPVAPPVTDVSKLNFLQRLLRSILSPADIQLGPINLDLVGQSLFHMPTVYELFRGPLLFLNPFPVETEKGKSYFSGFMG